MNTITATSPNMEHGGDKMTPIIFYLLIVTAQPDGSLIATREAVDDEGACHILEDLVERSEKDLFFVKCVKGNENGR